MADEPSFFAKLCCCSRETKEPPVTLIRSGLTPPPPPQPRLIASEIDASSPQTSQISPANGTVDGLVDETFEENGVTPMTTKAPKWRAEVEEIDEMNMNDVMMSELCGQEENQENVEDAVSIRTDVVEEVNEEDLLKLREQEKTMEDKEEKKSEDEEEDEDEEEEENSEEEEEEEEEEEIEEQETTRSKEYVTFSTMLEEGYESPRRPETARTTDEEEEEEEKETPTIKVTEAEDEEEESEEEIMVDDISETPPQPKPRSPQPSPLTSENTSNERQNSDITTESPVSQPKMSSMMYADVSSEEESSDDEAEREVLPPVARPEEDKTDVEDNWEDKSEKENRITRLSLKSNGQATMTTGAVRIALDSVELTDDEFSEKLI